MAREDEPKPIHVCIYGYSNLAKEIYESLRDEELLQVHITTRTVIERQRSEIDGKLAVELNDIIGKIDFWILLTPYDEFSDDRNLMEANLEYPTVA